VNEEKIKADMRLFALESVVCQHLAMIYQISNNGRTLARDQRPNNEAI